MPTLIVLFIVLLILSAFFSGSETAYFSIDRIIREKLSHRKNSSAKRVTLLLAQPRRLLVAILIGNTLVNVTAASIAAILTTHYCATAGLNQNIALVINVVVVTFLILVLSEITPKILAVKNAEKFASGVSLFLTIHYYVFLLFSIIIDKSIALLTRIFKFEESAEERLLQSDEFQALLKISEEKGELETKEREMIHSIFEFGDTVVREIMIPRTDMICVAHDTSINEIIDVIKTHGHTRIPVYMETIDQIQGIINAKDLLPFISDTKKNIDILKLGRPAIFVPESKKIDDLLKLFQKERQHMAIVVDEYGGTSGIVTLEDVIEEIVGEIRDEYDQEQTLFRKIDDNTFIVNAKIDVDSLNKLIDLKIPMRDEYETLGGFILELTGSVPNEKDVISHGEYEFVMQRVEKNRIVLVRISRKPELIRNSERSQ